MLLNVHMEAFASFLVRVTQVSLGGFRTAYGELAKEWVARQRHMAHNTTHVRWRLADVRYVALAGYTLL